MNNGASSIRTYFAKLGLGVEIADIYLALHTHGPQTISELSRNSHVERTRIYRLIETLLESNLIEVESHYKRGVIKAAPINNLRILISEKEQELKNLQDELELIENVLARNSLSNPATRVQFYHGPAGIRQMQWNLLQAKGTVHSIMAAPMQEVTGAQFFKSWCETWNKGSATVKLLFNEDFLKASNAWHKEHPGHKAARHISRLIPAETYSIDFSTDIYTDVVAHYNWVKGDVFGMEIYNPDIASAQLRFFEMLWSQASSAKQDIGRKEAN